MNEIALEAQSETAFSGNGEAEINAYLADPDVQLNGINDLERIYIQQYLSFFLLPNEAYVFAGAQVIPETVQPIIGWKNSMSPSPAGSGSMTRDRKRVV